MGEVDGGIINSLKEDVQSPEVVAYQNFLSKIWNHSLVDKKTEKFREEFKPKIQEFFSKHGMNTGYIAVPVGSVHSLADSQSDMDIILFLDDKLISMWNSRIISDEEFKEAKIDIRMVSTMFNKWNYPKGDIIDLAFAIMLCPDEFVAGDIERLRELRLVVADIMSEEKQYWKYMDDRLEMSIRTWHEENTPIPFMPNKGPKVEGRVSRLDRVKATAGQQEEKYNAWITSRKQLERFPMETMIKAVRVNRGALSMTTP